jgi:hypothetical protein
MRRRFIAGEMLGWGEMGIRPLSADYRTPHRRFTRCERDPVLGAAATTNFLYVLRRNGLAIYDTSFCEVGQLEIEGHSLAIAGLALAVATGDDVVIFDLTEPRNPHRSHSFEVSGKRFLLRF